MRLPALTLLSLALAAAGAPAPAAAAPRPIVAVADSGVDLTHPAFAGQVWRNAGEIPGNGLDDDGNGIADDINGADFVDADGSASDPRGHGTHVAGLIARRSYPRRRGGRRTGVRIMALRVLGSDGTGTTQALVEAIDYATRNGARVLNLSVAYYEAAPSLREALERAAAAGVLVVAAAGNDGEDLDLRPVYPASFRVPTLLAVAAVHGNGLAAWSARGALTVDIAAPGVELRSALPGRRHGYRSGTSQATAVVARAAAGLMRARPSASALDIRAALLRGARRVPALDGEVASGGRLDLARAIAALD